MSFKVGQRYKGVNNGGKEFIIKIIKVEKDYIYYKDIKGNSGPQKNFWLESGFARQLKLVKEKMLEPANEETITLKELKLGDILTVRVERAGGVIFEIKEEKKEILDEQEKKYLRGVIRPFRDRVKNIEKVEDYTRNEFITINTKSINGVDEKIDFPYFKKGTMYKGMEKNKKYTLEELGL